MQRSCSVFVLPADKMGAQRAPAKLTSVTPFHEEEAEPVLPGCLTPATAPAVYLSSSLQPLYLILVTPYCSDLADAAPAG